MLRHSFYAWIPAILFALPLPAVASDPNSRSVRFDVPIVLPAAPFAESPDPSRPSPSQEGRRWIDVEFPVTLWPHSVDAQAIERLEIEIVDLGGDAFVVDHLPRREAISEFIGTMSVERTRQQHWQANLALDSSVVGIGSGRAGFDAADRRNEVQRYERRLPQEIVAVGGTTQQGRGAAFRFERSLEMTLEGTHRMRVLWSVPLNRCNGLLRIDCRAIGSRRHPITGAAESYVLSTERLLSAYFDAGDASSRAVAERWASQSLALRSAAARLENQKQRSQRAEPWKSWLRSSNSTLPQGWLERIIVEGRGDEFRQLTPQLPTEIQRLGAAYLAAHRDVVSLTR